MTQVAHFSTFEEMSAVLATNTPHALVQDWWARLEGVLRACVPGGLSRRASVASLLSKAHAQHYGLSGDELAELNAMRRLRNACAHGEAPPLSKQLALQFARRAHTLAWDIAERRLTTVYHLGGAHA